MDYKARFYSPTLGRFIQPDSIIPNAANPQNWNRYSYVLNNPIRFNDPTGHRCAPEDPCQGSGSKPRSRSSSFDRKYGISFEGNWKEEEKDMVRTGVRDVGRAFQRVQRECRRTADCESYSDGELFNKVYGGITFARVTSYTDANGEIRYSGATAKNVHRIEVASLPRSLPGGVKTPEMAHREGVNNIVHELGHAFAQKWYPKDPRLPYDPAGPYVNIPGELVNNEGFYLYPGPEGASQTWRQHSCTSSDSGCPNETYADMFLGWIYDTWADNEMGDKRRVFMDQNMAPWVFNWTSP